MFKEFTTFANGQWAGLFAAEYAVGVYMGEHREGVGGGGGGVGWYLFPGAGCILVWNFSNTHIYKTVWCGF